MVKFSSIRKIATDITPDNAVEAPAWIVLYLTGTLQGIAKKKRIGSFKNNDKGDITIAIIAAILQQSSGEQQGRLELVKDIHIHP